ncbi:MAG: hypothetical protein ACE5FA_00530, partial [Dehalococcoidia bacterium]
WDGPETARYHITQDDVEGSGVLKLEEKDGTLVLSQEFDVPEEDVTDSVIVEADPETLRPRTVSRVIDGPDGQRLCNATYAGSSVSVDQVGEDEDRTDVLDVPDRSYDTWGDLFLWRTMDFRIGSDVSYRDVLTCSLAKPELLTVGLAVKEIETVTVRAGTFDAWRVEIRSGGGTQEAWFSIDDSRVLVKYDNGLQEWELESFDQGIP